MSRIRSNMSREERATHLSRNDNGDHNSDAFEVCKILAAINDRQLELLDTFNITGAAINELFEICGRNIVATGLLLRGCEDEVSGLNPDKLMHAINNRGAGVNVKAIITEMISRQSR